LTLKQKVDPVKLERRFERAFLRLEGIYRDGIEPKYALSEHTGVDLRKW